METLLFLFLIRFTYFYLNNHVLLADFASIKTKGGGATEKKCKMLILGVSRNIIYLLIF